MDFNKIIYKLKSVLINNKNKLNENNQTTKKSSQIVSANEGAPKVFLEQIDNYDEILLELSKTMNLDDEIDILAVLSLIFQNENFFNQYTIKISSAEITISSIILNYEVPTINQNNTITIDRNYEGEGFFYSIEDETNRRFKYQCILTNNDVTEESLKSTIGSKLSLLPVLRLYSDWKENGSVFTCTMNPDEIVISFWDKFCISHNYDDVSYNIGLKVQKPTDENNDGYVYLPKNIEMLQNYFQTLKFPVNLDKVYKDICRISFDDDMNKYPLFDLYILTQKFSSKYGHADGFFTDMITLENGKLVSFGLTTPTDSESDSLLAVVLSNDKKISYVRYTKEDGFLITNNISLDKSVENIGKKAINYVSAKAMKTFPNQYQNILIINNQNENHQEDVYQNDEEFHQESFMEDKTYQTGPVLTKKLTPSKHTANK